MPFDGSGNFTRAMNWVADATAGIKILSSRHDTEDNNFASGLSNVICKDGQSSPTADINWNGKKITNLGAPVSPSDAVTKAYADTVQPTSFGFVMNGAGVNNRLAYTQGDMSFFVRSTGDPDATITPAPKFVWNDKADGTGSDITTLNEAGHLTIRDYVMSATNQLILGPTSDDAAENGNIYLRPQGVTDTGGQFVIGTDGAVSASTTITAADKIFGQYIQANGGVFSGASAITFRPNGWASGAGQATLDGSGNFSAPAQIAAAGNVNAGNAVYAHGNNMYLGPGGGGRILQFQSGYYLDFNTSTGYFNFVIGGAGKFQIDPNGGLTIQSGIAVKTGGGTWQAPSDIRLKTVHGAYEHGLAEALLINPKRYAYNNEPDVEWVGLVAQEVETVLPETVTLYEGEIDGKTVTDLRQFDPSPLTYMLINAVKELSAKLDAAEARIAALEGTP